MAAMTRRGGAPLGRVGPVASGAVGAFSVLIGALALLASGGMGHYLAFGAVLCAGGTLLGWSALAGRPVWIAGLAASIPLGVAGLLLSLLISREEVCCMFGYHRGLGYPWNWVTRYGTADTLAGIEELRRGRGGLATSINPAKAALDGLFWWHLGLLVVFSARWAFRAVRPGRVRPGRTRSWAPGPERAQP